MATFQQLGIAAHLIQILNQEGIQQPTPVQEQAIPYVLRGTDVMAKAQTGTGKTLAFLLPMLTRIDTESERVQGLILTPTRELALQITAEVKKLSEAVPGLRSLAVYGGQDVEKQMSKLKRHVHLVVATPGRLLDHLRRGTITLGHLKTLVLDEADQMLHIGFLTEVEEILSQASSQRQTLLFSATLSPQVRKLAKMYMKEPVDIQVKTEQVTVKGIRQLAILTTDRGKLDTLHKRIQAYNPYLAIVFCRTKRRADKLNESLQSLGLQSDVLHGDLSQAKREAVMERFRKAKLQILVATDVASRGLDVEGVTHIFNYDMPADTESYIHRIGRTGRAGEEGLAVTLFTARDRKDLQDLERGIKMSIPQEAGEGKSNSASSRSRQAPRSEESRQYGKPAAGSRRSGERNANRGSGRSSVRGKGPKAKPGEKPKFGDKAKSGGKEKFGERGKGSQGASLKAAGRRSGRAGRSRRG